MTEVRQTRKTPAHPTPVDYDDRPTLILVTCCVQGRRPLLSEPAVHELIRSAWQSADRWQVGRYVVMPDHVHFFCRPVDRDTRFRTWMEFWRATVTKGWLTRADVPIWQKDYWDTQLRRHDSYSEKWEYLRRNPVRAGLVGQVDDWPYQGEMNSLPWVEH